MLVTHKGSTPTPAYLEWLKSCVAGGVTCVQLREKDLSEDDLWAFACALKKALDEMQIPLIINDHVELCLQLGAAGVHLGQSDMAVEKARSILGPQALMGLSVNTIEQLQVANHQPIDYVGIGAIFPTQHKPDIESVWGLDGLREAASLSRHPIVAIGGIDASNTHDVKQAGAYGIAGIGVFHQSPDPFLTAQTLTHLINPTT